MSELKDKMINFTDNNRGSICIDVTPLFHIDDMIPVLKAILMWKGYAMRTIDEVFDWELRELKDE